MGVAEILLIIGALTGVVVAGVAVFFYGKQGTFAAAQDTIAILKEQINALDLRLNTVDSLLVNSNERVNRLENENGVLRELVTNAAGIATLTGELHAAILEAGVRHAETMALMRGNTAKLDGLLTGLVANQGSVNHGHNPS